MNLSTSTSACLERIRREDVHENSFETAKHTALLNTLFSQFSSMALDPRLKSVSDGVFQGPLMDCLTPIFCIYFNHCGDFIRELESCMEYSYEVEANAGMDGLEYWAEIMPGIWQKYSLSLQIDRDTHLSEEYTILIMGKCCSRFLVQSTEYKVMVLLLVSPKNRA